MKTYLFLLLFVFQAFSLSSQISLKGYNQEKIDPSLFEGRWKARWISYPGEAPNVYGVYHFRKSFDLEVVPSRFIVHVSADNRYKLYVNGKLVSLGPARGDIYNHITRECERFPHVLQCDRASISAFRSTAKFISLWDKTVSMPDAHL